MYCVKLEIMWCTMVVGMGRVKLMLTLCASVPAAHGRFTAASVERGLPPAGRAQCPWLHHGARVGEGGGREGDMQD